MKSNTACRRDPDALFERARGRFESIVDRLGSAEGRSMDLSDLEKRLKKEGNELMRELFQSHMDLRSLGSVEAPVTAADGVDQTDRHRRERSVETVFGTVEVDREQAELQRNPTCSTARTSPHRLLRPPAHRERAVPTYAWSSDRTNGATPI